MIKKVGQRVRQSKQCLYNHNTLPKHNRINPPSQSPPNRPLIPLPNLQLNLHLHALRLRMVPLQSPPPHPTRHIPAPRPALHILAPNALHLCNSSNDTQWHPPLADLTINIPRESRDIRPFREGAFNDKYRGVFLYCHHFRSLTRDSCPAGCGQNGV